MRGRSAAIVAAGILLAATACATEGVSSTFAATTSAAGVTSTTQTAETSTSTGTAGGGPSTEVPPESDIGRIVRAADDGTTLTLRVGQTAVLIQADPLSPDPKVDGGAIEVVETVSVAGTGDRRWEIRAVRLGSATIATLDGAVAFTIAIEVIG